MLHFQYEQISVYDEDEFENVIGMINRGVLNWYTLERK